MEKIVIEIGFGLTCLFFMLMFCIGTQFVWGTLVGIAITAFGWFFWDE